MKRYIGIVCVSGLALAAGQAHAQIVAPTPAAPPTAASAADIDPNEITVTARKRSETVQNVPLSITALDASALSLQHVNTIADIKTAPSVQISEGGYFPSGAVFYIRGIGNTAQDPFVDTPVAVSIDGVYLATTSGSLVDLFDVQQVEVLRGPQGTLQGRNAPGGAVNIMTRRPTGDTSLEGEIGYGRFNAVDVKLAGETAVTDTLAVRASMIVNHDDGYIRNLYDGSHLGGRGIYAGRLSLFYKPSDRFDLFVSGDWTINHSQQTGGRSVNTDQAYPRQPVSVACSAFGFCTPLKNWTADEDFTAPYRGQYGGVSATANLHLGGVTLTSVTGYRQIRDRQNIDVDSLPIPFIAAIDRRYHQQQASEELRLASDSSGPRAGRLDWVLGGIYFWSHYSLVQPVAVFGVTATQYGRQTLRSGAAFGQATYHFTDRWSLSAGFRQTWDRKRYDGIQPGFTAADEVFVPYRSNNLSFEAGTEYKFSPDALLYFRFSQGYRAGGINGGASLPQDVTTFKPETVNAYEIGAKTQWFDRRLTFDAALFQSDYSDLQREVVLPENVTAPTIRNAATARIRGIEIESSARPTDFLTLRLGYSYLDAKYRNFFADLVGTGIAIDNSGLRLPFTPHNTLSLGADLHFTQANGDRISLIVNTMIKSKYTLNVIDVQATSQKGYETTDISIHYDLAHPKIGFEVYGLNIFGSHYSIAGETLGGASYYQVDGPRSTYGARVTFKF